jgi:hypothetical protein
MRLILLMLICTAALVVAAPAFSDNPPGGNGQPNQSCEAQPSGPPGFNSGGFTNVADSNYAGNGDPSLNANSGNAVSQYDVACFQVSQH